MTTPTAGPHTDFTPLLIGESLIIVPPDTAVSDHNRRTIFMARGAFGSGDHETTRSCLEIMETWSFSRPPKILDLGSGTAILSIAALKLFGGHAWCVDVAESAVASARHNCDLNQMNSVTHHCGTLDTLKESAFDLILANIYGDILLDVAEDLVARATAGATILLSGILWEYNVDIRKRYQSLGCTLIKNRLLDDFSTVLLEKTWK
ncbi:50S ribosomal protein L11 methyltransferase [Pelovirga terrestris]|uniref:50S ribosomal protein L11 methyltransferase n=1 Tax=Pelovirga terrestris TaxID=2771352 RepID=A0A8J6UIT8_9BACT|nr:50S ribosomal protein L11 methyltransferase [Pelovirga terrestris]MBD1401700.1 50S ribosomal protein L11 methyltransferase [Pelovirga terrestris]